MLRPSHVNISSSAQDRESLRAQIKVALGLAIGNSPAQAHLALARLEPTVNLGDSEITALYFQARAVANIKARAVDEGFKAFELALEAARIHGEPALCGKILNNYGTAAVQDGGIDLAIACLEEALEKYQNRGSSRTVALLSLAEALFAAGDLQRAAVVLRAFHTIQSENSARTPSESYEHLYYRLAASAVGIPVGMMLPDKALLRMSYDPSLLDLGFARREDWLIGPLVEAFCIFYEDEDRRDEHDTLLTRGVNSLSSLDNSLHLGIRVARLGTAHQLPRVGTLMSRQCAGSSSFLRSHKDLFDSFIAARRQMVDRARELGLRAAREFARVGRPFMQALALEAAGFAEEAQEVRCRCGARTEAMRLRWTGEPVPRRLATSLTARESEVARLIAGGSTNRTIALRLGISERTVHRHCESIFAKLGIHSSRQLSAALAGISTSE